MTLGLVFWILMLLWFVFGLWWYWTPSQPRWGWAGHSGFLFILFLILGWHAFGPPIHG